MRRREFIALGGFAAIALPVHAGAQQVGGLPIGFLQSFRNENVVAFFQGLRDAGYVDGRLRRLRREKFDVPAPPTSPLAKELVDLECDVIVAGSRYAFEATMTATRTIPIVGIDLESDPVASGWAKSLGYPGGNLTNHLFLDLPELSGKLIELLKEAVPTLSAWGCFGIPPSAKFSLMPRRRPHAWLA